MESPTLANVEDVYPLTAMQQGMLYHTIAAPSSGVYVNQIVTPVAGELDGAALASACATALSRHATLRTAFLWEGLDEPLQVVRAEADLMWNEHDLSGLDQRDQQKQIRHILDQDRSRGFDLSRAPLSRMALVSMGPKQWVWVWTFHHLIADGWSVQVILDEIIATYRSIRVGLPLALTDPPRYRDFIAHYLRRDQIAEHAFWSSVLEGFSEPHQLEVPGLPPREGSSGHRVHTIGLGATVTRGLVDFARANQVTLNTAIAGAWSLVLSRWVRSPDVVFGTTVSGRPTALEGAERATGLFINTLPLRVNASPTQRLGPWLKQIQRSQVEAREHELASLASIQRWADVEPGESLFQSILVFENYPPSSERDPGDGVSLGSPEYIEQSNYPLAILAVPGDEITLSLVYDSAFFSDEAIASVGDQIVTVAKGFVSNPEARLAEISLLSPEDERRLSVAALGPDLPDDDRTIHEIIETIAAERPDAPAVTFEGDTLSYGELLRRADALATRLVALGVDRSQPVGLYLHRSIEMVVGIVGILRSGAAYVPLDPSYPQEHIATLLSGDAIDVVVTQGDLANSVPQPITTIQVEDRSTTPTGTHWPRSTSADLAYIIHTSGSTGRPKGVMVTHRNLVHSTNARNLHYGGGVKRFLLLSSFSFDSSIAGIFWTLTTGGTLVLPSPGLEHDADALLDLAQHHEVTHTLCLPTLYQVLLEHAQADELATLEVAIVAGEACPPGVLEAHMALLPRTQLHNEYGPTEATVWCTAHRASPDDVGKPLPIGRPIAGARISLLDTHGHRVPLGFPGELCAAGPGLTPGYLNRPDLTAERFVTVEIGDTAERVYRTGDLSASTPRGDIIYLGRTDQQIKVRGHRIEAGAVESALRSLPTVRDAAVIGRRRARTGLRLIAFVVPSAATIDVDAMGSELRSVVPDFMVPDEFVELDDLPRLPNRKIDYRALANIEMPSTHDAPSTDPLSTTEERLASIWSDALGIDVGLIGRESDFFALGGDSLLAIRVTSAIRREFEESLPLASLVRAPTLATLSGYLEDRSDENSVLVPMSGRGPETLYLIHPGGGNVLEYQPLSRHLPDSIRAVGVQAHGVDGLEDPDRSIGDMTERYAAAIEQFQPTGIINLAGHSTGGLLAFEVARTLQERGRTVGLLALLDATFPIGRTRGQRLARHWDTIREGGWRGVRTVAVWNWATVRINAGRIRHGRTWRKLQRAGEPLPPDLAGRRINHIALRLQSRHEPGEFKGKVTYIRAQDDACDRVQASPRLWRNVAEQVDVKDAPGRHTGPNSMMVEHNAKSVAWIIADELGSHVEQPELPTSSQSS